MVEDKQYNVLLYCRLRLDTLYKIENCATLFRGFFV